MSETATQPVTPSTAQPESSLFQRYLIGPIIHLLRVGCSPSKLAWSLAFGVMIGINPLLGSTTIASLLLAFLLRLNLVASQIANHIVYPLQLALFLVFIKLGDKLFHTGRLPMDHHELFYAARHHPIALTRALWQWEWHALIIWAVAAAIAAPIMATILTPILAGLHHKLHKESVAA